MGARLGWGGGVESWGEGGHMEGDGGQGPGQWATSETGWNNQENKAPNKLRESEPHFNKILQTCHAV